MAITPVTINGKTIPMPDYDDDASYTGTDNGATQCLGFGYKVYKYLWGSYTYGSLLDSFSFASEADIESGFADVSLGAMFTGKRSGKTYNHTVIIIGKDGDGVTVYDANWSPNKVGSRTWTWAQLKSIFSSFVKCQNPS